MPSAIGFSVAGTVFSESLLTVAPRIVEDARLFLLPGDGPQASVRNWTGRANASVIGTPSYHDGYAGVNGANGFEGADPASSGAFTYLTVQTGNNVATGNLGLIGRWRDGEAQDLLYSFGTTAIALAIDGAQRHALTLPGPRTEMRFLGARYDGASAKLWASEGGALISSQAAYAGTGAVKAPLRVGGTSFQAGATANSDTRAAIAWDRAISDQEVTACYEYLRALIASRGGSVE